MTIKSESVKAGRVLRKLILELKQAYIKQLEREPELADLSPFLGERLAKMFEEGVDRVTHFAEQFINKMTGTTYERAVKSLEPMKGAKLEINVLPTDRDKIQQLSSTWVNAFKSLTEDMKSDVRQIIADAHRSGTNPRDLIPRMKDVFEKNSQAGKISTTDPRLTPPKGMRADYRAELIGRTLVTEAWNASHQDRYERSGQVWGKKWVSAPDERRCEICRKLDGNSMIVKLNENFEVTDKKGKKYSVPFPPLHCNCRCRILPVTFVEAEKLGKIK